MALPCCVHVEQWQDEEWHEADCCAIWYAGLKKIIGRNVAEAWINALPEWDNQVEAV
jgi:hypothetical protein